jgi:uncharacterized damage-inducible protein DinB
MLRCADRDAQFIMTAVSTGRRQCEPSPRAVQLPDMPQHAVGSVMKQHLQLLAAYHLWAFETLYEALLPLVDARYRADCGLFFHSIHGTLNHLLVADCVWFGRVIGQPFTVSGLDAELETDRAKLEQAIYTHSARWHDWLAARNAAELGAMLEYSNMSGTRFAQETTTLLLHVFNHATHHRGQISAAITAAGLDAPEMDLIWYLRRAPAALG